MRWQCDERGRADRDPVNAIVSFARYRSVLAGCLARLQSLAKLLASPEEGDVLFADRDAVAGTRVAANALGALLNRERAETPQLHPIATR
jgi:hypothetical protein